MRNPKIVVTGWEENKVSAIRTLRLATKISLKEAKDAVELEEGTATFEVLDEGPLKDNTCLRFVWEVADEVERRLSEVATMLVERRDYESASEVLALIGKVCR